MARQYRSKERHFAAQSPMATVRRAFDEFLMIPTAIIIGCLLLAAGLYVMERSDPAWLQGTRAALRHHVFADPQATADVLGTIAGSLIAVTSITISLLLLALQQTAASLSTEVFDQFLRRRHNQFYFGFFVGLSLFALVTLATVNDPFNPVLAATIAFLLTIVALFLLIVLLYTTMNQMRPVEIVEEIHRHAMMARGRQLKVLARTRRTARRTGGRTTPALTKSHGYVTHIDLDALARVFGEARGEAEIVFRVAIGGFVSTGDRLADISCANDADADALVEATCRAVRLERQREIVSDPTDGIEELAMIAWTSISTSKSNPAPGLLAIRGLRDLLARWSEMELRPPQTDMPEPLPIVLEDTVPTQLLDAFESLAVVSSESMQHQALAEIARAFAVLLDRMPQSWRVRAGDVVLRSLSALGDHVLTADLEAALNELSTALTAVSLPETARAVETARSRMHRAIGVLHSRATRVEA